MAYGNMGGGIIMARQQTERKMFRVGDGPDADFSMLEIENLTLRLIAWFKDPKCDRNFSDPEQQAKDIIQQCLKCVKQDGDPWKNAPHTFQSRIRVKAAYDMETGAGIPIRASKHPDAVRRLDKEAEESANAVQDIIPALVEFDIEEYRQKQLRNILSTFPELDNPVHLPNVRRLALYYSQQEMIDRMVSSGSVKPGTPKSSDILDELESLNKSIDALMKTLDIHPDSLRKKIKENTDGTLGDLVVMLDMDEEFKEREKLWALQAALQLWYMHEHPNGDLSGPQMEEWEIWHMTRTRPFSFTCKCGIKYHNIIQGFTPKELKEYLIKHGILIEVPAIPGLITHEDVEGIGEFIDAHVDLEDPNES
jgi:hypothetical protein